MSTSKAAGWTVRQIPSQNGKRIFITGANSGVGYSAALELARRGAVVLMGCRDRVRGEAALARLRQEAPGPDSAASEARVVELDLASLASVRRVADDLNSVHQPLHGLINNAGVMSPPKRKLTQDGFELQFGTNVLGHFALTCQLMPALAMAGQGDVAAESRTRVVTLSSIAHKQGRIYFDDIQSERQYSPMGAYQQSKLADLMFAFELERRLRERAVAVSSMAVHPGVARTSLFKVGNSKGIARVFEQAIAFGIGTFLNSEAGGAVPTLFAMTAPEAEGGGYYGPQSLQEMRGGDVGPAVVAPQARDEAAQQRLWSICEQATGCTL